MGLVRHKMIVVVFPLLAPWALITHGWRVAAACDWLQCMLGNGGALFCTIFNCRKYSGADSKFRGFFTAHNQPECRILLESSALWELCDTGEIAVYSHRLNADDLKSGPKQKLQKVTELSLVTRAQILPHLER